MLGFLALHFVVSYIYSFSTILYLVSPLPVLILDKIELAAPLHGSARGLVCCDGGNQVKSLYRLFWSQLIMSENGGGGSRSNAYQFWCVFRLYFAKNGPNQNSVCTSASFQLWEGLSVVPLATSPKRLILPRLNVC